MNASKALVTVGVVVGSTEARKISEGHAPTMKPVIAGFVLGFMLIALGNASNLIADRFALLLVIGALLYNGVPLIKATTK